ncbi:MAG: hypothetical protein AB1641_19095 [Thermodesulfobacteriota bacterium]
MNRAGSKDLIALVADKNMEYALRGLLNRGLSLRITSVRADVYRHPEKDCGCRFNGVEFLCQFITHYQHALLMFDYDGSGRTEQSASDLEKAIEADLIRAGWSDRAAVIVIDPELEAWVWSDSPHVDRIAGWSGRRPSLREWLRQNRFLEAERIKPKRPKEAFESALREARIPRSSSLYFDLANRVGLERCRDDAFLKFKRVLQTWFGP